MSRPRKPTEVLERSGAYAKDPQRRRPPSPKSNNPLGDPPEHLTEIEVLIWHEMLMDLPMGVATRPDRHALANLCQLEAKARDKTILGVERNQLFKLYGQFGMTPADRSRVLGTQPDQSDNNPFTEFS